MNIEIIPVNKTQRSVLRQLTELYLYDFSEFTEDNVNEHGFYDYSFLDLYWLDPKRLPFFIKVDGNFAGFALVSSSFCCYTTNNEAHNIDEFFVMRKYRRMNIGNFAAKYIFDLFKGEWEVKVRHDNKPALTFWKKVINEYTNGDYTYHSDPIPNRWEIGIGYTFNPPL